MPFKFLVSWHSLLASSACRRISAVKRFQLRHVGSEVKRVPVGQHPIAERTKSPRNVETNAGRSTPQFERTIGHRLVVQGKAGDGKRRLQVQCAADENVLTCHGLVFFAELGNFPSFSRNRSNFGHSQFSLGRKRKLSQDFSEPSILEEAPAILQLPKFTA